MRHHKILTSDNIQSIAKAMLCETVIYTVTAMDVHHAVKPAWIRWINFLSVATGLLCANETSVLLKTTPSKSCIAIATLRLKFRILRTFLFTVIKFD